MAALDTQGLGNQGEMIRQLTPHDRTLRELHQYLQFCVKGRVLPNLSTLERMIVEFHSFQGQEEELEEVVNQISSNELANLPTTFRANFLQRIQDADILSKAPTPKEYISSPLQRNIARRITITVIVMAVIYLLRQLQDVFK